MSTTTNIDSNREWLRGSLDLAILSTLSASEKYGYQILADLRDSTAGRIDVKAGTLYPALHALEAARYVQSRWEEGGGRDRKWYALTPAGRRRLRDRAQEWYAFMDAVRRMLERAIGEPIGGGAPPGAQGNAPA